MRILKYRAVIAVAVLALLCAVAVDAQDVPDIEGTWEIDLQFVAGSTTHTAVIQQEGNRLSGDYKGQYKEGDLRGSIEGDTVNLNASLRHQATGIRYNYTGTLKGDTITGTVSMGEYWDAEFTATKKE